MEDRDMNQAGDFNFAEGMKSDQDIIRRVLEGDTSNFELIMRRYNQRLYRIARGILRNEADAEDTVQDAYIRAYENLERFLGKGPLSAWLAKITVNEALGRLRRSNSAKDSISLDDSRDMEEANFMASSISSLPSPEQSAARGEVRRLLESVIDSLPEVYRLVFILCGVEEMSVAETADCLEIEPATVRTRYHRARKILQQNLSSLVDSGAGEVFAFAGKRCDRIVAGVFRRLNLHDQKLPAKKQ
jgi:RNA polymerase sigma-70 factor, ECF subfamily